MTENDLSRQIVDAAYRIHTTLGPGLLESVYALTLAWELEQRGLRVVRQSEVPVVYQGTRIEAGFRADLIVDDQVIVEVKSVETLAPVHKKTTAHLSPAGKQAPRPAHQLQRGPNQRRHHANRQRAARMRFSQRRKARKDLCFQILPCPTGLREREYLFGSGYAGLGSGRREPASPVRVPANRWRLIVLGKGSARTAMVC